MTAIRLTACKNQIRSRLQRGCMKKSAVISDCEKYRYQLIRQWDDNKNLALFIGLNPSIADDEIDDPTIRRCIGFAKRERFGGFIMANLFAYRATSPCDMKSAEQPVGELNEYWLEQSISSCKVVIVCWGGNDSHLNRHIEVNELLKKHANNTPILCFGKTKAGQPKHPLYLASNTELINYFN